MKTRAFHEGKDGGRLLAGGASNPKDPALCVRFWKRQHGSDPSRTDNKKNDGRFASHGPDAAAAAADAAAAAAGAGAAAPTLLHGFAPETVSPLLSSIAFVIDYR